MLELEVMFVSESEINWLRSNLIIIRSIRLKRGWNMNCHESAIVEGRKVRGNLRVLQIFNSVAIRTKILD